MAHVASVTDATFSEVINQSSLPVLVDFWAPWCGPCQMLGPILDEVAQELNGVATICKINIDENPNTPSQFGIRSIPTMILFANGQKIGSLGGVRSKADLVTWIREQISAN